MPIAVTPASFASAIHDINGLLIINSFPVIVRGSEASPLVRKLNKNASILFENLQVIPHTIMKPDLIILSHSIIFRDDGVASV